MKYFKLAIAFSALVLSSSVNASVITFDDSETPNLGFISDGYGGFNWNLRVVAQGTNPGSGYDLGTVSGGWVAWNNAPSSVSVSSGTFDFTGAYFASAWDASLDIVLEGWSSSTMLFTDTITVNNQGPTWFGANYAGIDELKITSLGQQFAMDDFTYNEVSAVPVPAAAWLFGSGLLGLVGVAKRKKA